MPAAAVTFVNCIEAGREPWACRRGLHLGATSRRTSNTAGKENMAPNQERPCAHLNELGWAVFCTCFFYSCKLPSCICPLSRGFISGAPAFALPALRAAASEERQLLSALLVRGLRPSASGELLPGWRLPCVPLRCRPVPTGNDQTGCPVQVFRNSQGAELLLQSA